MFDTQISRIFILIEKELRDFYDFGEVVRGLISFLSDKFILRY